MKKNENPKRIVYSCICLDLWRKTETGCDGTRESLVVTMCIGWNYGFRQMQASGKDKEDVARIEEEHVSCYIEKSCFCCDNQYVVACVFVFVCENWKKLDMFDIKYVGIKYVTHVD